MIQSTHSRIECSRAIAGLAAIFLIVAIVISSPIITGWLVSLMAGTEYDISIKTWLAGFFFNVLVAAGGTASRAS